MKKIYLFCICAIISTCSLAQTPTLSFDGVDDYIDLGTDAGSGIRTLECWFKLDTEVNSTLSQFSSIVIRDTPTEFEELFLCFYPTGITPSLPGHLVFGINLQSTSDRIVYSDSNYWEADRWYHVAGVINPVSGMSLYIDGIKQISTESNTNPSEVSSFTTTVGSWGNVSGRNFAGSLDDLRFSSDAIYTANFTPPCPDLIANVSTIGLWNFNSNLGTMAVDSSSNSYDGLIYGSTWNSANICGTTAIEYVDSDSPLINIYPNPSTGIFHFQLLISGSQDFVIDIYNSVGQRIISKKSTSINFNVNLENQENGIYFYKVTDNRMNSQSGRLIKW